MPNDALKKLLCIMNALSEEFDKGKDITGTRTRRWDKLLLQVYGIDEIEKASLKIIKARNKYKTGFPEISEMISVIEGSSEDTENIALSQFITAKKAIVEHGSYVSIQFDDAIIHKVIEGLGGWQNFCMTNIDQWHWREKEFVRLYCLYTMQLKNNTIREIPEYLHGIHANNKYNYKSGYKPAIVTQRTDYPREIDIDLQNNKRILENLKQKINADKEHNIENLAPNRSIKNIK